MTLLMVDSSSPHSHSRKDLVVDGVLIPDAPHIITPAIRRAMVAGKFEAEEARELPRITRQGDVVLEIGAGIGFISTLLDRDDHVDRVIAVEANPRLMPYMADLHARNGVSKVHRKNAVLTNRAESKMTFYLRRDFWMGSLSAGPNPYEATVEVPTESLDDVIRDNGVSLIVCDVEGAEAFLFEDADLANVDRIYLELHDHVTGLAGVKSLIDALSTREFTLDPRHSIKSVVLFRRVEENEVLRPYEG